MGANDLPNPAAVEGDGLGCHSGKAQLLAAAQAAGKSEVLAQYAKDYPLQGPAAGDGPHEQPQQRLRN